MATPAQTFLGAYQAADASMRDWQRIAMQQQAQANALAQQRIENEKKAQAQDFNQMLALLKRGDENTQFGQTENRLWAGQRANIAASEYNAATGRMNAATSRYNQQMDARRFAQQQNFNNDPIGLMGGSDSSVADPPLPSIPSIDDPKGGPLFNFGGRTYSQDWGPATASVFGGADDPEDNGLSAFGGTTGAGGREGVAIPQRVLEQTLGGNKSDWSRAGAEVTLANGQKAVLPIADLGTAERIWERNQGPTLDLTPGAVNQLGGTVLRDNAGKQAGVRLPAEIANVRVVPDYQQAASGPVAAEPPDLSLPAPAAPEPPLPAPQTSYAGTTAEEYRDFARDPLLPPPSSGPLSFSGTDLTGDMGRQMTALRRESELAKIQQAEYLRQANEAKRISLKPGMPPQNRAAYRQKASELAGTAQQLNQRSSLAESYADQLEEDRTAVRKRQDEVGKLSVLDGVLPNRDVQGLLAEASDPTRGGSTEQKVKTLLEYHDVRQKNGLSYPSRGLASAMEVARTGKLLDSVGKDLEKVGKYEAYQEHAKAIGDTNIKDRDKWLAKALELKPAVDIYNARKAEFAQAVRNDVMPEPASVIEIPEQASASTSNEVPADDIVSRVNSLRQGPKKEVAAMPYEEQRKWSEAKDTVSNFLGDDNAIVSQLADYAKAARKDITTLDDLKKALSNVVLRKVTAARQQGRRALADRLSDPADNGDMRIKPEEIGLTGLPMNAGSAERVIEALAEDIWSKRGGRDPQSQAASVSPGLGAKDRQTTSEILNRETK